ncbi:hypothetical protein GCM10012319_74340 [Comamonas sp. KCTC 72670]|nr:hypothetical protein GCM10012319_74340 [Comamonas sp. KCTC 72670]
MDRLQELVRLHRLGTPARQVARVLRMGVDVERNSQDGHLAIATPATASPPAPRYARDVRTLLR